MDALNFMSTEEKRAFVLENKNEDLLESGQHFTDLLTELFFLQHDGNYIEFSNFKKRPSKQLLDHIQQNPIISNKRKLSSDSSNTTPHILTPEPDSDKQKFLRQEKVRVKFFIAHLVMSLVLNNAFFTGKGKNSERTISLCSCVSIFFVFRLLLFA